MSKGDTSLIRELVPTRWMFDFYTDPETGQLEANSRSPNEKPFFSTNIISFRTGEITTKILRNDPYTLLIDFSSFCLTTGRVMFETVIFPFSEFVKQLEKIIDRKSDFITFNVPITTDWKWRCEDAGRCVTWSKTCAKLNKLTPSADNSYYKGTAMAAVQFNLNEVKHALAVYHGIEENYGGFKMKNNMSKLFSGMEMGMNKDSRIKSTLMGIVVQNPSNGKWYAFDPATRTRKDMMNLKFGDFPIVLLPVRDLSIGDLIKRDGKYYYVQSTDAPNTFTGINAMTGEIQTFLYEESLIPGLNFFTKVVAFDAKTMMDPNSKQNMGGNVLGAMLMMQMMNSDKADFSLDDINDDSFNGLGTFMPLLLASKDGNLGLTNADGTPNIMAMMMLCSDDGSGGLNDFMKVTLLSNLLGGNNAAPANIFGNMFQGFGGAPAPAEPTISVVVAKPEDEYECTLCGKTYDDPHVRFCTECGGKVGKKVKNACKKCGAELKDGAKFCHVCGTKIGPEICNKCGAELPKDAKFCPKCGFPAGEKVPPLTSKKRSTKPKAASPAKPTEEPAEEPKDK